MYEGAPDYPDKDIWWELCDRYGVTIFYTAPTAIRACMKWGAEYPERHDLSAIRLLGTVGEPINPKAWLWYWKVIGGERCADRRHLVADRDRPHHDHDAARGAAVEARLRRQAAARDRGGGRRRARATRSTTSRACWSLRRPWPGMLRTLYRDDDRYVETYFSKFGPETYFVGDAARKDADGYFWVIGRVDDVINVSGHRLSTAEVESAIVSHPKVAECAVIGQADEHTGQAICAFVTLEGDLEGGDELIAEINEQVASRIGKFARPKRIVWADDLPKTRSGKIMRRLLRDIAEGRELGDVTTLRDPDVVKELDEVVKRRATEGEEA